MRELSEPITAASREDAKSTSASGAAGAWMVAAMVTAAVVAWRLRCGPPIFTFALLAIPLVDLLRHRDPGRVGIRRVGVRLLGRTTAVIALASGALFAVTEPWSNTYAQLVDKALSAHPLDSTFAWVVRLDGAGAWTGLVLYSGLVTIFAEELFFRGWLIQLLCRRTRPFLAITAQAALFTLLQALAAAQLSPLRGSLYAVVYAFVAGGLVGGWAAWRTASIWPTLALATTTNALLTFLVT